jgi:phosphate transport system substrate-binding protein
MTSPACEYVLGLDGVAVIVNGANSAVTSLHKEQIRKIFSGGLTDWSQVKGGSGPIAVFTRDEKSGTFDTFKSLVLDKEKVAPGARRFEDSGQLSTEVAANPGAIGFIGLPYIKTAKAVAVAFGEAPPIFPTSFTVATEEYPLSRRLYLYAAAQPANRHVREFLDFALSTEGQEIVEKSGFVPLGVKQVRATPPAAAPLPYQRYTRNASRLSLNFRFSADSARLDSRGVRDLDRLLVALAGKELQGRPVMLFGFSEDLGNEEANLRLSLERVRFVEKELKARGVPAAVAAGFGARIPVADNGSPEGRHRNNRVEVWLGR